MKTFRALYMLVIDILALPFLVIFITIMNVINVVHCVRHNYGLMEMMNINKAIAEGLNLGVEQQIYWVNHGKNYLEVYLEEKGS